jgi:hypothetical protein
VADAVRQLLVEDGIEVLQAAMMGRLSYPVLAHPTLAGALNNLFMTLD